MKLWELNARRVKSLVLAALAMFGAFVAGSSTDPTFPGGWVAIALVVASVAILRIGWAENFGRWLYGGGRNERHRSARPTSTM